MNSMYVFKTGKSETFAEESSSSIVSYGDILRTLMYLESRSERKKITIVTSKKGKNLIECFDKLNIKTTTSLGLLKKIKQGNSSLINLEKNYFSKNFFKIENKNHFGFIYYKNAWHIKNMEGKVFSKLDWFATSESTKSPSWFQKLELIFGAAFDAKNYFQQSKIKKYDIGLNWKVGSKWPSKQIPIAEWQRLEHRLSSQFKTSWQTDFEDIVKYVNWISSCRILITSDSLGLHIAHFFNIPTLAFFGPTSSSEINNYKNTISMIHHVTDENHNSLGSLLVDEKQVMVNIDKIFKNSYSS